MKKILIVFAIAGLIMTLAFRMANWRAQASLLLRYCDNPAQAIALVDKILEEGGPAEDERRRPYIIAAKLLFLVPQQTGESRAAYLERMRREIEIACAAAF